LPGEVMMNCPEPPPLTPALLFDVIPHSVGNVTTNNDSRLIVRYSRFRNNWAVGGLGLGLGLGGGVGGVGVIGTVLCSAALAAEGVSRVRFRTQKGLAANSLATSNLGACTGLLRVAPRRQSWREGGTEWVTEWGYLRDRTPTRGRTPADV